jgi:hypothetical protein
MVDTGYRREVGLWESRSVEIGVILVTLVQESCEPLVAISSSLSPLCFYNVAQLSVYKACPSQDRFHLGMTRSSVFVNSL